MAGELQGFFKQLADRLAIDIAEEWERAVEKELVEPIRNAAPEGRSDHLKQSVRKVQGWLNDDGKLFLANGDGESAGITRWVVMAGGPLTTKAGGSQAYAREAAVSDGEAFAEGTKTVSYDYAMATEYGTQHERSHPFFWPTVRSRWPRLIARAAQILSTKLAQNNKGN